MVKRKLWNVEALNDNFQPHLESITVDDEEEMNRIIGIITNNKNVKRLKEAAGNKPSTCQKKKKTKKEIPIKVIDAKPDVIPEVDSERVSSWTCLGVDSKIASILVQNSFCDPTKVQLQSLPKVLTFQEDIVVAAETGSGKTLVYSIAISQMLCNLDKKSKNTSCSNASPLRAIVLAPTRELAVQIGNVTESILKPLGKRCVTLVGGLSLPKQNRLLDMCPEVVVATPGRFWDLCHENPHNHLAELKGLRLLVFDEVDRLAESGHFKEVKLLIPHIRTNCHYPYRTILLSATLTTNSDVTRKNQENNTKLDWLVKKFNLIVKRDRSGLVSSSQVIDLTTSTVTSSMLFEQAVNCGSQKDKLKFLFYILFLWDHSGTSLSTNKKVIVFVNTIDKLKLVEKFIQILLECSSGSKIQKIQVLMLHSHKQQKQRFTCMEKFKAASQAVLLTTDVAARGIDVPLVDLVVHFDTPTTSDIYVHRSGRTARNQCSGHSILLLLPEESQKYKNILSALGRTEGLQRFSYSEPQLRKYGDFISTAYDIVSNLQHFEGMQRRLSWYQDHARKLDLTVDPEFCPLKKRANLQDLEKLKSDCKALKKVLKHQMSIAI